MLLAAGVVGQPGGHGHVLGGHFAGDPHLGQGLVQHVGDVAVGADPVIQGGAHAVQVGVARGGPAHIGLADDEDGIGGGPALHSGGAGAVAGHIELAVGGEHILAVDVVAALQEGDGGVHIGLLRGRVGPALHAGLQHEQGLSLLVHQVDPALVLQELSGVHPVGDGHDGEVGADGGLGRDIHGDAAAIVQLAVAVHVDALGIPAGQGQLRRLGVVIGQLGDAVIVRHAVFALGAGHAGGAVPGHAEAEGLGQIREGHVDDAVHLLHGGVAHGGAHRVGPGGLSIGVGDAVAGDRGGQPQLIGNVRRHHGAPVVVDVGGGAGVRPVHRHGDRRGGRRGNDHGRGHGGGGNDGCELLTPLVHAILSSFFRLFFVGRVCLVRLPPPRPSILDVLYNSILLNCSRFILS